MDSTSAFDVVLQLTVAAFVAVVVAGFLEDGGEPTKLSLVLGGFGCGWLALLFVGFFVVGLGTVIADALGTDAWLVIAATGIPAVVALAAVIIFALAKGWLTWEE